MHGRPARSGWAGCHDRLTTKRSIGTLRMTLTNANTNRCLGRCGQCRRRAMCAGDSLDGCSRYVVHCLLHGADGIVCTLPFPGGTQKVDVASTPASQKMGLPVRVTVCVRPLSDSVDRVALQWAFYQCSCVLNGVRCIPCNLQRTQYTRCNLQCRRSSRSCASLLCRASG
jgi:hypothetical protein